jgi:succinyl-CoA synthetase beta subunit
MNLHEYQSKRLLADKGVAAPRGFLCRDGLEALIAARELNTEKVVLKAQAHTGGRGKAGGIAVLSLEDDIRSIAAGMLGSTLVTNQTGPRGKPVNALLVEEVLPIDREIYLGVVLDRNTRLVTVMASSEGGMEIEAVAKQSPEKIFSIGVHPMNGLAPFQARRLAYGLTDDKREAVQLTGVITALFETFVQYDCTLAEINPLVISGDRVIALDAKINLDDNALFLHPEMELRRDRDQEDPVELSARKIGLSYIKLDGNIGCVVNGAGLAMATLDLISIHRGRPANFLDVGGGASEQQVADAMNILLDDTKVKAVFINIFGGILRCDVLARGVIKALKQRGATLPVVARIEGTNIEEGRELFERSGLPIEMIPVLNDAAAAVTALAESQ